jgi:hypothetical protein
MKKNANDSPNRKNKLKYMKLNEDSSNNLCPSKFNSSVNESAAELRQKNQNNNNQNGELLFYL